MDPQAHDTPRKASAARPGAKPRTERGSRTHRGLTCANCRSRKTRCDGSQPTCKTCEVYRDECRYEKAPPMSHIIAMARRLQDAEQTVADLRRALEARGRDDGSSSGASPTGAQPVDLGGGRDEAGPGARRFVRSPTGDSAEEMLSDLSLDGDGKLCYFGPTSSVHNPPDRQNSPPTYDDESSKSDVRTLLTSKAIESRAWEEFALGSAALRSDVPKSVVARLLQIHWAWVSPSFGWVYRPAFMRDMTTEGPYFSPLLLAVLCGHAARFHESGELGDILIARARLLMGAEIHRPSAITTVQALLQLSARDLAHGQISQAWLYSGMAFRMVSDLGLHHGVGSVQGLGQLNAEDLEIRRRLFWSCYFWDKTLSLYLGRRPMLVDLPSEPCPELLDDFTEHEPWTPFVGDSLNLSRVSEYPATKTYGVSCFENSCKLAVIINDIVLRLYSRRGTPDADGAAAEIKARLDDWRERSPPHLRYEPDSLPAVCPPPHILAQNLLFYTSVILLHRPFYSAPAHHAACRRAADAIERLLLLLERTFGFTRLTYLIAYCAYTGASVLVQDVKLGDVVAVRKVQTYIRALRQGVTTCPLIQRSLDIITSSLHSSEARVTVHGSGGPGPGGPGGHIKSDPADVGRNYLPAFPYPQVQIDPAETSTVDVDAFSFLDCFPENYLDHVAGGWTMPS